MKSVPVHLILFNIFKTFRICRLIKNIFVLRQSKIFITIRFKFCYFLDYPVKVYIIDFEGITIILVGNFQLFIQKDSRIGISLAHNIYNLGPISWHKLQQIVIVKNPFCSWYSFCLYIFHQFTLVYSDMIICLYEFAGKSSVVKSIMTHTKANHSSKDIFLLNVIFYFRVDMFDTDLILNWEKNLKYFEFG